MTKNTVSVDVGLLSDLIDSHLTLSSLDKAGVDNWDGYDVAMEDKYTEGLNCSDISPSSLLANNGAILKSL